MKIRRLFFIFLFYGFKFAIYASEYKPESPIPQVYFPDGMCWTYLVNENSTDTLRVIIENHNAVCYLNNDSVMTIKLLQHQDEIIAYIEEENSYLTIYMFSDNYNSIADFYAKDRTPQFVHPIIDAPVVLLDGRIAMAWTYDGNRPKDIEFIGSEKGVLFPIEDYIPCITSESRFLLCSMKNQLVYKSGHIKSSITKNPLKTQSVKAIKNGHLLIEVNGQTYDALGRELK